MSDSFYSCRFVVAGLWATVAAFFCFATTLGAQKLVDGVALVTTVDGEVRFDSIESGSRPARLHESIALSSTWVRTGEKSFCGLSLSNGVGLVLGPETKLHVNIYQQRPYLKSEQSLGYEASISRLELTLESGRIGLDADGLSPLSKVNLTTPHGVARTHSVSGLFAVEEDQVRLIASDGNLVFTFFDQGEREFLGHGQSLRISRESARRSEPEERFPSAQIDKHDEALVAAAAQASRRVLFLVEGRKPAIPRPHLAVRTNASTVPLSRPYGYRDNEF